VPGPESVRRLVIGGRALVVWRSARGRVVVLDDRCPHQGNELSNGTVVGEALRCSVHGWEVGTDGWCDRAGAAARQHRAQERDGVLLVEITR
jgi:phenylpropionate dioxygenase-like ring-hydroxylating dioxygenase large terminal subunit